MRERNRSSRCRTGGDAEDSEADHFARIGPGGERSGQRRTAAEEHALHHGRGDGADQHAAENAALRCADDFFEREYDAGERHACGADDGVRVAWRAGNAVGDA